MNILHLHVSGELGGIEILCRDINRESSHNNFFYFVFEGGCVAEDIEKDSGIIHIANERHSAFLSGAKRFVKYCKTNKIDIVLDHSGSPITRFFHTYAARRLKNVRFILYLHSNANSIVYRNNKIKDITARKILMSAYKYSTGVAAISRSVKDSFAEIFGFDENRITVVYNGINKKKFYHQTKKDGVFHLIYVGRVVPYKGIKLLINTMNRLDENMPIHLDIIGSDPDGYTKEMKLYTKQLGLCKRITFHGPQNNVPQWLSGADLFVHPAVCEEGFGITLIEAMAAQIPCVAFNKGAIPEIIQHEKNGFIVEKCSPKALADMIEQCYTLWQSGELDEMAKAARKTAEYFTIENTVKTLEALYE